MSHLVKTHLEVKNKQKFDFIISDITTFDLPYVCGWTVCRQKESEKKTGKERAEAEWRDNRCSNKSEEPQSQQSALWETISTHNKSLLVIDKYTMIYCALVDTYTVPTDKDEL